MASKFSHHYANFKNKRRAREGGGRRVIKALYCEITTEQGNLLACFLEQYGKRAVRTQLQKWIGPLSRHTLMLIELEILNIHSFNMHIGIGFLNRNTIQ